MSSPKPISGSGDINFCEANQVRHYVTFGYILKSIDAKAPENITEVCGQVFKAS